MASALRTDYLGAGGVGQVARHVRHTLLGALRGAGSGQFALCYETFRTGKYRVFVDGTVCQRFYVASEEVAMRLQQIGKCAPAAAASVDDVLLQVERTLLAALNAGGFGHFEVRYERSNETRFEITIDGTEQHVYAVTIDDVSAAMRRVRAVK